MFKNINRNTVAFLFLFFFSFLNYNFNFLNISGTDNFYNIPASNTEIESTDGILYGLDTGDYLLGRYTRKKFRKLAKST